MNRFRVTSILAFFLLAAGLTLPVFALDAQQKKEFNLEDAA